MIVAQVAKWIRHWSPKPKIAGSSPALGCLHFFFYLYNTAGVTFELEKPHSSKQTIVMLKVLCRSKLQCDGNNNQVVQIPSDASR